MDPRPDAPAARPVGSPATSALGQPRSGPGAPNSKTVPHSAQPTHDVAGYAPANPHVKAAFALMRGAPRGFHLQNPSRKAPSGEFRGGVQEPQRTEVRLRFRATSHARCFGRRRRPRVGSPSSPLVRTLETAPAPRRPGGPGLQVPWRRLCFCPHPPLPPVEFRVSWVFEQKVARLGEEPAQQHGLARTARAGQHHGGEVAGRAFHLLRLLKPRIAVHRSGAPGICG